MITTYGFGDLRIAPLKFPTLASGVAEAAVFPATGGRSGAGRLVVTLLWLPDTSCWEGDPPLIS